MTFQRSSKIGIVETKIMTAIITLRLGRQILKDLRIFLNPQRLNRSSRKYFAVAAAQYSQLRSNLPRAHFYYSTASTTTPSNETQTESLVDHPTYERVCSETLESLCDYFEELTEQAADVKGSDVSYGDGVLTVKLGHEHGTYVINRQSPNKQIWLSSPTSGPKRYDFVIDKTPDDGKWVYKHNGETMHTLLQRELQQIFINQSVDFSRLPYSASLT